VTASPARPPRRLPPGPLSVITPDGTRITQAQAEHVALVAVLRCPDRDSARDVLDALGLIGKPRPPAVERDRSDPYRSYSPRATAGKSRP
jgi:hypothetical protein